MKYLHLFMLAMVFLAALFAPVNAVDNQPAASSSGDQNNSGDKEKDGDDEEDEEDEEEND